ncbi:glycosyltransferase family 4 protein, partial [Thioclava sp. BHET1]
AAYAGLSDRVTILFLGQLSARKGVPELLGALSHPTLMGRNWHAVLAGDGPVDLYRRQALSLGLAARIDFPGWLDRAATARLLATADILVLPSHAEGLAMAVLEGLAHGLAVVTTPVGAHDEVIDDGASGLFVPVGDVDALAATLERLCADSALRAALGRGARAAYLRRYAISGYVEGLERLYARRSQGPQSVMG